MNIEEPVAEMAVANGTRIGILATLPTSPAAIGRVIMEKAAEAGKEIELVNEVVDGAFDVLCSGDREKHDRMVCEALYQLAEKVDVIAFAQSEKRSADNDTYSRLRTSGRFAVSGRHYDSAVFS